jgi:hypothetical protein
MSVSGDIRDEDKLIFGLAAMRYNVFVLVRAANKASLNYIDKNKTGYGAGEERFSAKRVDCKAKTADNSIIVKNRWRDIAGLVVDPELVGPDAFEGDRYGTACTAWTSFASRVCRSHYQAGRQVLAYFPSGMQYGLQLDENHPRYGCVMFSVSSLISAATYIHGDYDLYAIVPADNRAETVFVNEQRLGTDHARSKEFFDVQHYLNHSLGRPMILHGEQENMGHTDDLVFAFYPDGWRVKPLYGRAMIEDFYRTDLGGRKAGGGATESAGGQWRRVT